jgi:GLPGLI family protein
MRKILFLVSLCFVLNSNAQTAFISAGQINYEVKINQYKRFEGEDENSTWIIELKKQIPKMITENYTLKFNENKSVYKMASENTNNKYLWNSKPSETDNIVNDFKANKVSIQRDVYEQTYLLQDSARKLDWKITQETREVAGFECKKAVAKICDSVYVVAFYTNQILVSGGPESFSGLPGMIMGLAVPRLGVTWFATKLLLTEPTEAELTPKQKGKKTNWVTLEKDMTKALKDWGNDGKIVMWSKLL